jgi:hypothetical protein
MDILTDQERRTRKAYRVTLLMALIAVVGITLWMVRPVTPIDLRFLGTLKPVSNTGDQRFRTLVYKQPYGRIEKAIDTALLRDRRWTKSGTKGFAIYDCSERGGPSLSLTTAGPGRTTVDISDSNGHAKMP